MKKFIQFVREDMDKTSLNLALTKAGFEVKQTTVKKRLAIVSDTRSETMQSVMSKLKEMGFSPFIDKTQGALRISSIGIIKVDSSIEIVVKPKSKNVLKAEEEATDSLIALIKDAVEQTGSPITVMIGSYKIENVVTAGSNQIKGDPKADIALIDDKGKEVGFISHKKEGGAAAFQQYGGISKQAGDKIYNHKLVIDFVKDLEQNTGGKGASGKSAYRYIPNTRDGKNLVGMSVYGPDYNGGGRFNRQSVHCIGQGAPALIKKASGPVGVYDLKFSEAIHTANEIDWAFKGTYKAIFGATYRAGRKITVKGGNVTNMRGGIYPYDFIAGRKAIEI